MERQSVGPKEPQPGPTYKKAHGLCSHQLHNSAGRALLVCDLGHKAWEELPPHGKRERIRGSNLCMWCAEWDCTSKSSAEHYLVRVPRWGLAALLGIRPGLSECPPSRTFQQGKKQRFLAPLYRVLKGYCPWGYGASPHRKTWCGCMEDRMDRGGQHTSASQDNE